MTTHPEIRPDKNGNFVTRHVKNFVDGKKSIPAAPPVQKVPDIVSCGFCLVEHERGTMHTCRVSNFLTLTNATKSVMRATRKAGGTPVIVGGTVRDAILNRIAGRTAYDPKDVDIEVYGVTNIDYLLQRLRLVGSVKETGVSFGVIKVSIGSEEFDISLPRRESKTGNGHRGFSVEIDSDIEPVEAFGRRDFTINAIGYGDGMIIDPFGGVQDLENGILRHTTSAFADDPLRVLRGVQFAARFGFEMAPETIEECARIKDDFSQIAPERVWGEFDKILTKGKKISSAIDLLEQTGWMEHFPSLGRMRDVPQDTVWHPEGDVLTHLGMAADRATELATEHGLDDHNKRIVVFSAMVHDFGKYGAGTQIKDNDDGTQTISSIGHPDLADQPIKDFGKSIGAPHYLINAARTLTREHMSHIASQGDIPTSRAIRNLVRRLGETEDNQDASLSNWAIVVDSDRDGRGTPRTAPVGMAWLKAAREMNSEHPQKNLVDGGMLRKIGLTPGVIYGDIIKASKAAQDDEIFTDKESAETWARTHIDSLGLSPATPRINPRK